MRKIIVFSREKITNYGDPIIADCAKYILQKLAREEGLDVKVSIVDVYAKDGDKLQKVLDEANALVFPGGGMNSVKFNQVVAGILDRVSNRSDIDVYFNAIGINRRRAHVENEKLLQDLFSRPQVRQVTTRGDLNRLCSHLASVSYAPRFSKPMMAVSMWRRSNPSTKELSPNWIRGVLLGSFSRMAWRRTITSALLSSRSSALIVRRTCATT